MSALAQHSSIPPTCANHGARGSKLTRSLAIDKFPSSAAFDAINSALTASDADRKDAIKQGGAIFGFTLKNAAGETESWHIDLKEKGEVVKGLPEKPTGMSQPYLPCSLPLCFLFSFALFCIFPTLSDSPNPCYIAELGS